MMSGVQDMIIGAVLALLFGFSLVIALQHHQIVRQQAEYEQLLSAQAQLQAINRNWALAADNQNKKIEQMAEAQQRLAKYAERAVIAARKEAKKNTNLAARIAQLKNTPIKSVADDCASAMAVKDFYFRHAK